VSGLEGARLKLFSASYSLLSSSAWLWRLVFIEEFFIASIDEVPLEAINFILEV